MKIRLGFVSNSSSSSYTLFDNGVMAEVELGSIVYYVRCIIKDAMNHEFYYQYPESKHLLLSFDMILRKLKLYDTDRP